MNGFALISLDFFYFFIFFLFVEKPTKPNQILGAESYKEFIR